MAIRPAAICGGLVLSFLTQLTTAQPDMRATETALVQGPAQPTLRPAEVFLSYDEARPAFEALGEPMPSRADWPQWVAAADRETRARVAQGDEMSVVNLLLFGTSFTSQPRITFRQIDSTSIGSAIDARLRDFERAVESPGNNERLQFARRVLGDSQIRPRLLSLLDRAIKEGESYARLAEEAASLGDPSLQFAERSRMYRARGLASDTSVRINFAVEQALRDLVGLLGQGTNASRRPIRRVAIIGPGLDFTDKQEGYDFYPPQTMQPFAIVDTLIRFGLAEPGTLKVTTFDLSDRVTAHIAQAGRRARDGAPYTIYLPLDGNVSWTPALLDYWRRFGDQIGGIVPITIPPGLGPLRLRAISVRPSIAAEIAARDLNITAQRLALESTERFDVVVATNIFVYYDRLQQALGMINIARMLRPGGVLLSNNALVEVPGVGLRSGGYVKALYSDRDEDGDLIIWYQTALQ